MLNDFQTMPFYRTVAASVIFCSTVLSAGCLMAEDKQPVNTVGKKVEVTFSGGHETDPRDKGRPVVLIASALDVTSEVFRDAFSGVRPAQGRGPTGDEARRNKEALMKVLQPHGITNDRLDEVSNYYRYKPGKGNLWKTTQAKAYAVVEGGKVKQIVVTELGSGYSSSPTAIVEGLNNVKLKVEIQFTKEFKSNGAVASVKTE